MHPSNGIHQRFGLALGISLACTGAFGCSGSETTQSDDMTSNTPASATSGLTHGTTTSSATTSSATTGGAATTGATTVQTTTANTTASTTASSNASMVSAATGPGGAAAGTSSVTSSNTTSATLDTTGAGGASASDSTASIASTSGAGGSGTGGGSVFPPGVTTPRIMIVGDSISAGPGCYKKYLVDNLTQNGITSYEFVGEYDDDCGGGVKHSAVSCTTSDQYTQATFTVPNCFGSDSFPGMATLVATHDPDLIMLQLGVNDVWGGSTAIEPILANYATLIEQARAHNPNVVVVVAQIHKIITDNCQNAASTTNAEALVTAVPAWALGVTTAASPVLVADLWTNSDAHEADDCVHPNDAGAQRMGLNWYNALSNILQ